MTAVNRASFFASIRRSVFAGALSQLQVDGLGHILDDSETRDEDPRWTAYRLATARWETAGTMQPIREYGRGVGKKYGTTYYGRGLVQLTWRQDYEVWERRLGLPLVADPDLALGWSVAMPVMRDGMSLGLFTGVGLPRYFNRTTDDAVNARRIINGIDKAATIAAIHLRFLQALKGQ